jgi:hypothetical protein
MTRSTPARFVPGAVEQHDLACCRQLLDVALEVPLALLAVGRDAECDRAQDAWAGLGGDPVDGAALARGVTTLEQHDGAVARVLDPGLQPDQLDLQTEQLRLVGFLLQAPVVLVRLRPQHPLL